MMVVCTVSRLSCDVYALTILKKSYTPSLRHLFPKEIEIHLYVFLDAEVSGCGISIQLTITNGYNQVCLV